MSAAVEEGRKSNPKERCTRRIWSLFPHVLLILSLMFYAALGAVMFQRIEKRNAFNVSEELIETVQTVLETVQNHNHTEVWTQQDVMDKIDTILVQYIDKKNQNQNWSFYGSLFFCCTVFTTVGYGRMYPITHEGKIACILYAMVGIPLMLLVISDVGDILAVLLSKAYARLSCFFRRLVSQHSWSLQKDNKGSPTLQVQGATSDGIYTFKQETMNIQQVIKTQSSYRRRSLQLRNNEEIFDRIIVKEEFHLKGSLTKSCSCPELDRMSPPPKGSKIFTDIGQEMDRFKVPLLVILLVVFAYMLICSHILRQWETEMKPFDAFYFTFITLTTIGFGDIVPKHPKYFMVTFLFIIMGMAIMSMAFKLSQSRIVSCYKRCIKCLSMGRVFEV